jgi:hypothetical protein
MPLQPNIALQVQGLQLPDPLAQSGRVAQIQNALQQQRMGEMQIQNALREQRRKGELEKILGGFGPEAKAAEISPALVRGGFLTEARTLMQSEAQLEETRRKAQEAEYKGMISKADLVGRVLGAARDQDSFDFAIKKLSEQGIFTPADVQFLGSTYDPTRVKRILDTTMSQKDRLEAAIKERATAATESQAATASAKLPFERQRAEAAALQAATAADRAKFERENPGFTIQETDKGLFKVNKRTGAIEPLTLNGTQLNAPERRPLTTVNIDRGEQAETVARGKGYVEHETAVRNAATAARRSLTGIESAQDVLNKGFETGFGTETIAKGASVLAALGVDKAKDFATNSQKFLQAATERVLAAQLEQKGVQTNQDAQRIEQTGARMGNTKAANEFILDVARVQAERAIAQDKFYRDWLRDPANKKSLAGAEDAWLNGEGGKSIFESPRLEKYGVLQAERAQSTPAPSGPVMGGRSATPRGSATMSEVPAFRTVHEAEAANLPKGTRITVGGRPAEVN